MRLLLSCIVFFWFHEVATRLGGYQHPKIFFHPWLLFRQVWDVVDKGLARGGVGRVPEGEDLEDAVAGLPPHSGPGEHEASS